MNDPVKTHIRALLEAEAARNTAITAKIREVETAGGRIGRWRKWRAADSSYDWEITDWRTGKVLATSEEGGSDHEVIEDLGIVPWFSPPSGDSSFPILDWTRDTYPPAIPDRNDPPPPDGLPASLAKAITEWFDYDRPTDEDIAAFVGLPAADVTRCRADPLSHPDMIGESTP